MSPHARQIMPLRLATRALARVRSGFISAFLTSAAINVLALAGSLFAIQIYDRVLPARSLPTLVWLLVLMIGMYVIQGLLEAVRARIMSRIGETVDAEIITPVVKAIERQALARSASGDGIQALRDADQLRAFLAGPGPLTLLDLPWLPLFVLLTFLLHPLIGAVTIAGAIILVCLLLITERSSKVLNGRANEELAQRNAIIDALRRNAETTATMGLSARLHQRFLSRHSGLGATQLALADITASYGSASRTVRQFLQALILSVGAYLVIEGQASAGIMFAASILTGRTLAPIEAAIAHWRQMQAARQSVQRLDAALLHEASAPTAIPAPGRDLTVKGLAVAAPGATSATLIGVDFRLTAGDVLIVLGPSGSGKSTLARGILGICPALAGEARLDGAALSHWTSTDLGAFTGYLPQTVELIDGTIAENIGRFISPVCPEAVVAAAKDAGVHEIIVNLPNGYDTIVGPNGMQLSGGQRQRVGLARALYGKPFLIVLDEPNAALDSDGEVALNRAIVTAKTSGSIVIAIAHRPSMLAVADKVLCLNSGRQIAFGPKREILERSSTPIAAAPRQPVAQAMTNSLSAVA